VETLRQKKRSQVHLKGDPKVELGVEQVDQLVEQAEPLAAQAQPLVEQAAQTAAQAETMADLPRPQPQPKWTDTQTTAR
jgi:hypothetical protein